MNHNSTTSNDEDPAIIAGRAASQSRSTRSREKQQAVVAEEEKAVGSHAQLPPPNPKRPRTTQQSTKYCTRAADQMAERYIDLASHMMLHPLSNLGPYGYAAGPNTTTNGTVEQPAPFVSYPLQHMSALAFLKSPVRRPTILERWSPYEIAIFEAALAEFGKEFHLVAREIGTSKSTKDVIAFYYIWKKTSHYRKWKKEYIPDDLLSHSDDDSS